MTVREKVVVFCNWVAPDPEVPVTVIVDTTGVLEVEELPPQPVKRLSPITPTASSSISCILRRFFQPKKLNAIASADAGNSGLELRWTAAVSPLVLTVSVEVEAAVPEGVTEAGEKLHDAPAGKPEQENITAVATRFRGVTETVTVPLCPLVTESAAGVTATAKLTGRL